LEGKGIIDEPREVLELIWGTPAEERLMKVGERELAEDGEKVEILDKDVVRADVVVLVVVKVGGLNISPILPG